MLWEAPVRIYTERLMAELGLTLESPEQRFTVKHIH
jgi:hypothetical protein